jgi:AraC family ethanolamine operon transcriptional activator
MSAAAKPVETRSPAPSSPANPSFSYTLRDTLDADEHAACLTNWQQQYDQLSAGPFVGEFEEFCFGKVQIFREALNQSVH